MEQDQKPEMPDVVLYNTAPTPVAFPREKLTRILLTAAERAGAGSVFRSIHVFGSYSRGALTSHDLDVIVTAGKEIQDTRPQSNNPFNRRKSPTEAAARKLFGGGIPVDCLFERSWDPDGHEEWHPKLVWSQDFPNAEANLARIHPDPKAGRFHRDHFVSVRRTGSGLNAMEEVMRMLKDGKLFLEQIPFPKQAPWGPNDRPYGWYRYGKDTLRVLPAVCWWFRQHGERTYGQGSSLEFGTYTGNDYAAHIGRIDLYKMLDRLHNATYPRKKVCLAPYLARGEVPTLYVFSKSRL